MAFIQGKEGEGQLAVDPAATPAVAPVGKTSRGGGVAADPVATSTRSARGAVRHLQKLIPTLDDAARGGEIPPLLALDARSALRRIDDAIEQLRASVGLRPECAGDLAELVTERTAIVPAVERALADKMAAWRAEAGPMAAQLGLGRVEVRSDDSARAVTEAKGARGVALGSTVYLHPDRVRPGTPDGREVLAHELVHLAQAKLPGTEAGQPDRDEAELEAGELAATLAAGGHARAPQRPIDLSRPAADADVGNLVKTFMAAAKLPTDVAWKYLQVNEAAFLNAFTAKLATLPLLQHPRLAWVGNLGTTFKEALKTTLGQRALWNEIKDLISPADPMRIIDQNRTLDQGMPGKVVDGKEPVGPLLWNPLVGTALAIEVGRAAQRSVNRLLPRYLIQADEHHPKPVGFADLVTSHPMDVVIARVITDARVLTTAGKPTKGDKQDDSPQAFRNGVRFLQSYRWLGEQDPALWNWIQVDDPTNATVEEVAASIWLDPTKTSRAHAITKTGRYFRVAPGYAHHFAEVAQYAPKDWYKPEEDNATALAESSFANEAALESAKAERKLTPAQAALPENLAKLKAALLRSQRQLGRMKEQLGSPKLWVPLLPAIHWIEKHLDNLYGFPDERLAALQPVIEGQQHLLFEIAGAVHELVPYGSANLADDNPLFHVLRDFAIAAGESFLLDAARAQVAKAKGKQATLALDAADGLLNEARGGVQDLTSSETKDFTHRGAETRDELTAQQKKLLELRAQHAAGQDLADGEMELVTAQLRELLFLSKTRALSVKLAVLANEARDSNNDAMEVVANAFHGDIRSLPPKLYGIMDDLRVNVHEPYEKFKKDDLARITAAPGTPEHKRATASVINSKLSFAQSQFTEHVTGKHDLEKIFRAAAETIQDARLHTMIFQIILLIAVGVAGGVVGSIVGGAVRGAMLANTATRAVGMMRAVNTARVAGTLANITADAAVNTVGQSLILGADGDGFLYNLASNALVLTALRPLHRVAAAWKAPEAQLAKTKGLWEKTKLGGKISMRAGTLVTAEMLTAAGVSYAMERAVKGPPKDEATAAQWVLQGASMALGRFISGRMSGVEQRLGKLAMVDTHVHIQMRRVKATALKVEKSGDSEQALEIMLAHQKVLDDEAALLEDLVKTNQGKVPKDVVDTLLAGNRAERQGVDKTAFAAMTLHMAGLTPDDASGQIWYGATRDISIALHYAFKAGVSVKVLGRDTGKREWSVMLDGQTIKIIENELVGRPVDAKDLTDAERVQARRYAETADFMQQQWEAKIKDDLDSRAWNEVDHFQVGFAMAGVMNQATMPSLGKNRGNFLVVYEHRGTLSNRGEQELGQDPKKFDAPGIRTSEQADPGAEWAKSSDLDRALAVGRAEVQIPAYRGKVTKLEVRPAAVTEAWEAPNRRFKLTVNDGIQDRFFYTDRVDNAGGMGPGLVDKDVKAAAGDKIDDMLATHHVILGDDPYYFQKLKAGEILVWGGTPTGAWAAEPKVHAPGSHVDVVGDNRAVPGQPGKDWNGLVEEYGVVNAKIAAGDPDPKLVARKAEIDAELMEVHKGAELRRNTKPGATYADPHAKGGKVSIEHGAPTKLEVLPNGRILATFGEGATLRMKEFDQIVLAHGQNPGADGGPGALLGPPPAPMTAGGRDYGDVPAGTIALKPVYSTDPPHDVIALESIDPPGIRLVGGAYAHKAMAPWVAASERPRFLEWLENAKTANLPTRDHGTISTDSTAVTPGIEHQRDKQPQANEALATTAFVLPGPKATLEIRRNMTPAEQDEAVLRFLAIHMRADGQYVSLTRYTDGKSEAIVYGVKLGNREVGVFKVFGKAADAKAEIAMLDLLATAHLKEMKPVAARGMSGSDEANGFGGAVLMDTAHGSSVKQLIKAVDGDGATRAAAIENLEHAMVKVADGLAEMHTHFGQRDGQGKPVMMDPAAKASDADWMIKKNFGDGKNVAAVKSALGGDLKKVQDAVGELRTKFIAAKVPATAYLGDANAGNFVVNNHEGGKYKDLGLIDVGVMKYSVNEHHKDADGDAVYTAGTKGNATGAADLARFLGSLETMYPGKLTPAEVTHLRDVFMREYVARYKPGKAQNSEIDVASYADAERWYRVELELTIMADPTAPPGAKKRLLDLLAPELAL